MKRWPEILLVVVVLGLFALLFGAFIDLRAAMRKDRALLETRLTVTIYTDAGPVVWRNVRAKYSGADNSWWRGDDGSLLHAGKFPFTVRPEDSR